MAKNDAEAVKWFRKAADQNDADAQNNLGVLYGNGRGVEKDYAEALNWFRKAADQNHALAQTSLGVMYERGQAVEKDYVEAYAWLNLAAKTDAVAVKFRNLLEQRMTSQQVAEAQNRTKELRKLIESREKELSSDPSSWAFGREILR